MGLNIARTSPRRDGWVGYARAPGPIPRICERSFHDRSTIYFVGCMATWPNGACDKHSHGSRYRSICLYDDPTDRQFPTMVGRRLWLLCRLLMGIHITCQGPRHLPFDMGNPGLYLHYHWLWPCRAGGLCACILVRTLCRNSPWSAQERARIHSWRKWRSQRLFGCHHWRPRCGFIAHQESCRPHPGRYLGRVGTNCSHRHWLHHR